MYRVVVYPEAADQLAELPASALGDYARVLDAVEVAPWNGPPHNERNPEGAMRRWSFGPGGAGQVLYLVLGSGRCTCCGCCGSRSVDTYSSKFLGPARVLGRAV